MGWYLHRGIETLNRDDDNFELASTPILNGLYTLQIYQTLPIAAIIQISISAILQTWYRSRDDRSYLNFKCFDHAESIDMKKMKVDNNILIYKIYLKVKQKYWPSYKMQHLPKDICEELHIDLMGLITPTRWNVHKYSLTITDSYSTCQ